MSRGSDVMAQVSRKSSVVMSEAGELKFEEAEELDEGEMKEVIIYLPPSQDDFDSEVARSEKYPFYVPNEVLHPCGAGASCVLKDLPQDVGVEMRPACYDSKSPLYAYSMRELGCKVEKRSLLNEILLRALREMEPSVGSFSDGHVIKSFYPRKGTVPSTKLFSVLAPSGQDKKLNSKQLNESVCAKSCLNEVTNSNLNPTVTKTCFKLNSSTVDNIKFERCKVEIKNLSENKNGPGNRNSNVSKHSERSLWFNGLFNKKVTFGGLVFISLSLLGYYNITGIQ